MRWTTMLYAVPVLLGLPLRAVAGGGAELAGWLPVADTTLAASRGGYDHGNGLLVSLSIERQLSLNGSEVASSRLVLPQLGAAGLQPARALGTGDASALPADGAALRAATDLPAAALPALALLLQNSENNQLIRAQTTINTTVNSLGTLKGLNFGDSLRQALSTAIAPR